MEEIFDNKNVCDLKLVKEKILELVRSDWKTKCQSKPKLRTYITFKSDFIAENYLKGCLPRLERSLLAQFRTGILPLRIETGRFRNVKDTVTGRLRRLDINERKCELCKEDQIEDEIHFVCKCKIYNDLRNELYNKAELQLNSFSDLDNVEKFNFVNVEMWRDLATYIKLAWNRRKSLLYN